MRQSTQAKLDEAIERLGGEAAGESSLSDATTVESDGREEAVPQQPSPPTLDIGWFVWLGSPLIDPAARKGGVVVDAQGDDSVVVARDRKRQQRQETWFEVWPIADIDMDSAVLLPSSKRIQAAKKLLLSIGETLNTGRWTEEEERRMAAAAVLTADVATPWRGRGVAA